jgi:ectoine hydroxylase-related dioxygenase (phytanoyl-CoA dioxygenase family)
MGAIERDEGKERVLGSRHETQLAHGARTNKTSATKRGARTFCGDKDAVSAVDQRKVWTYYNHPLCPLNSHQTRSINQSFSLFERLVIPALTLFFWTLHTSLQSSRQSHYHDSKGRP